MSVDPAIAAMLEQAKARSIGSIWDVPVELMRTGYRDRYRERSVVPTGEVERRPIGLETETGILPVTIYTPQGLDRPLPLIVYFHGGGFVLGDDAAYERQTRNLALGCESVVAFVDYRKAPEFQFPVAVEDALAATHHLLTAAEHYGFDTARVVLMGDSAGANLAINVALCDIGRAARLLCLLYPVVDLRPYVGRSTPSDSDEAFSTGYGLDFDHMRYFARQYLADATDADDPRASPVLGTRLGTLPQTVVFSAKNDVLFDQTRDFVRRAQADGVNIEQFVFKEMIHNFMAHANISHLAKKYFEYISALIRENFKY